MTAFLDNVLKYQKLDLEKRRILDELDKSKHNKMQEVARNEFNKAKQVIGDAEKDALLLLSKIDLEGYCNDAKNHFVELEQELATCTDIDKLTEGLKKLEAYRNKIMDADRKLVEGKIKAEDLFNNYKNAQEKGKKARSIFADSKVEQEKQIAAKQDVLGDIDRKLKELRASGSNEHYTKYDELAADKKLPPFVPLVGADTCGGCGMQNSKNNLASLKGNGECICETCRRVIYQVEAATSKKK